MAATQILRSAQVALADEIVAGWIAIEDGHIVDVGRGAGPASARDLGSDILMPGLIELHTDNLETHMRPRPKVSWPESSALVAFDAQIAASGITTVFDCIRVGSDADYAPVANEAETVVRTIEEARGAGILRADHRIHLRCEVCAEDVLEQTRRVVARHSADLISLMDHTPGARQFISFDAWRTYYGGKSGLPQAELDRLIARKQELFAKNYAHHRAALVALARTHGTVLASHDDATSEHVTESIGDGVAVAEFPTTVEAARQSHDAGIRVMMGAPNVVRGGSHSGNVAAEALARAGVLDVLSSDYVPASLLLGAFELARRIEDIPLADALRTVTFNPARAAGLTDRGEIAVGKRADLVRVQMSGALPVAREVFRGGVRVI
jgi:alpha-D-ribose 1-methylphosphonate 5-triphosphate diphosphatase